MPRPPDPDRPPNGLRTRLHLRLGRLAVTASNLLRPPLSLGVRLLALDETGARVFLVRHSYVPGLYLPGGGVEAGESCRDALLREATEEGGLALTGPPELFGIYWNRALRNRDHVVLYTARGARIAGDRTARVEVLDARFHPVDDLPDATTPATRARLAEVLDGVPPSETW